MIHYCTPLILAFAVVLSIARLMNCTKSPGAPSHTQVDASMTQNHAQDEDFKYRNPSLLAKKLRFKERRHTKAFMMNRDRIEASKTHEDFQDAIKFTVGHYKKSVEHGLQAEKLEKLSKKLFTDSKASIEGKELRSRRPKREAKINANDQTNDQE